MKIIVLDPPEVEVDESTFRTVDWKYFYRDVEEEDPSSMPEPLGIEVVASQFFKY